MKRFDIITIFPQLFSDFMNQALLARGIKEKLLAIKTHNLRDWTTDNHKTVDGRPYGGGAGMVLMVEPIAKAVKAVKKKTKSRVILLSAKGKQFTQADANRLAKYNQLVFICGRYEGVDERVATAIADEELSVGPYVLFGGEIPAMVMIESIARLIPSVIQLESLQEESHWDTTLKNEAIGKLEYPHYTRPEVFTLGKKKLRVPKVLLSGNHAAIKAWRDTHR